MTPSAAIEALSAAGLTEKAIGLQVGASQSAINKIRRDKVKPSWEVGRALIDLAEALPPGEPQAKAA